MPVEIPVTNPTVFTVPMAGLVLIHVPPVLEVYKFIDTPSQVIESPVIAPGNGLTVIRVVLKQPVVKV